MLSEKSTCTLEGYRLLLACCRNRHLIDRRHGYLAVPSWSACGSGKYCLAVEFTSVVRVHSAVGRPVMPTEVYWEYYLLVVLTMTHHFWQCWVLLCNSSGVLRMSQFVPPGHCYVPFTAGNPSCLTELLSPQQQSAHLPLWAVGAPCPGGFIVVDTKTI
jgi:hypothetical protein